MCVPDARVHYVVLKQQPHQPTPQPATTHTRRPQHKDRRNRLQEQKKHQKCPPCIAAKRSCCLRTQQCAKHNPHKPRPSAFLTPPHPQRRRGTAVLTPGHNRKGHAKKLFDSLMFPPMSTHRRTNACAMGNTDNPSSTHAGEQHSC